VKRIKAGGQAGIKGGGVSNAEFAEVFKVDRHVHRGMSPAKLLKQPRLLLR